MRKSKWMVQRELHAAVDEFQRGQERMGKALAGAAALMVQQADLLEQVTTQSAERLEAVRQALDKTESHPRDL